MRFVRTTVLTVTLALTACGAGPVEVLIPVSQEIRGASLVADVQTSIGAAAWNVIERLEAKARARRAEAGLDPVDPAAEPRAGTARDEYATLPFAQMLELMVKDVTRARGLSSGRPLKLLVRIDAVKTADAGMTILIGSSDELAGKVAVRDAATNEELGEFYVTVVNSHQGLIGLAMRGGGIREELAEEFAIHIARQLGAARK